MLGGNMSEAFFGKVNPFSPVDGNFYCENALNAVGKFISQQHDREIKKISQRVNRYTQGYTGDGKPNRAQRRYNNKHHK
jgi:ribosomal protein L44E